MLIAHLAPSLDAAHAGRSVVALAGAMAAEGHDAPVLTLGAQNGEDVAGAVRIRRFKRAWPRSWQRSPALLRHLQDPAARHTVIHHHGLGSRTLQYACRQARRDGTVVVVSPGARLVAKTWERLLHPDATRAVAGWHVRQPAEAEALRTAGVTQPICVAAHGFDSPSHVALVGAREHWHRRFPDLCDRPTALFHGAFHSRKRVIDLIDLWLAAAPSDWILLITGYRAEYGTGELRSYVHRNLGIGRIVIEPAHGHQPPFAAANLFLNPCAIESVGRETGEAMAAGLPVLMTDSCAWHGRVPAEAAWSVRWEDFREALTLATRTPLDELASRGQALRRWVAEHASWAETARTLVNFYRQCGAKPEGPR